MKAKKANPVKSPRRLPKFNPHPKGDKECYGQMEPSDAQPLRQSMQLGGQKI